MYIAKEYDDKKIQKSKTCIILLIFVYAYMYLNLQFKS